ncbi:MAG: hypothetical protein AAF597_15275, partial [Bacteroidota bacterium]
GFESCQVRPYSSPFDDCEVTDFVRQVRFDSFSGSEMILYDGRRGLNALNLNAGRATRRNWKYQLPASQGMTLSTAIDAPSFSLPSVLNAVQPSTLGETFTEIRRLSLGQPLVSETSSDTGCGMVFLGEDTGYVPECGGIDLTQLNPRVSATTSGSVSLAGSSGNGQVSYGVRASESELVLIDENGLNVWAKFDAELTGQTAGPIEGADLDGDQRTSTDWIFELDGVYRLASRDSNDSSVSIAVLLPVEQMDRNVGVGDFDGDGIGDVVYLNPIDDSFYYLAGLGGGAMSPPRFIRTSAYPRGTVDGSGNTVFGSFREVAGIMVRNGYFLAWDRDVVVVVD